LKRAEPEGYAKLFDLSRSIHSFNFEELCFVLTFSSKPYDAFQESPNWSWFIGLGSLASDHLFDIGFVE